jgi:hypothetical protein
MEGDVHEEAAEWDVVADDDKNSEEENEQNDQYCAF